MLLSDKDFDASKILAVAHQDDLAAYVDFQFLQLLKILWGAVVGVDHFGFHVSGRRHAIERHDDPRIVLIGIIVNVLARGTVHFNPRGSGYIHADF